MLPGIARADIIIDMRLTRAAAQMPTASDVRASSTQTPADGRTLLPQRRHKWESLPSLLAPARPPAQPALHAAE